MWTPIEQLTADGYDLQFGTNVLGMTIPIPQGYVISLASPGHFYFTKLLLPTLVATAKTSPDGKTRVVNTASIVHSFDGLNFDTFMDSPARTRIGTKVLYNQSKRVRLSSHVHIRFLFHLTALQALSTLISSVT
jgi:NAD(P)-dependent dehydrogenase (short-subunit alcohol dehydrogenase family)